MKLKLNKERFWYASFSQASLILLWFHFDNCPVKIAFLAEVVGS